MLPSQDYYDDDDDDYDLSSGRSSYRSEQPIPDTEHLNDEQVKKIMFFVWLYLRSLLDQFHLLCAQRWS
jgi:hypothetical protein